MIYSILDWAFTLFHTVLIVFNLTGWIWKRTRKIHLFTISATLLSWTVLGLWYGWGYCPLTDWHWKILREAGYTGLPSSYIVFLLRRFFNFTLRPATADFITVFLAVVAFGLSVWKNTQKRSKKPRKTKKR